MMVKGKTTKADAVKATKVQIRLRTHQKEMLARAAKLQHKSLSHFLLEHALQAAEQVLAEQVQFVVPPEQWRAFCQALDAPPRVISPLKDLFKKKSMCDGPGTSPVS